MPDGVLVIDKPSGPTSHDVVASVRRALDVKKVGHTGTLDPMATGVLPLVLGRATRLAQFLSPAMKTYHATVRLGVATDTYDATGTALDEPMPIDDRSPGPATDVAAPRRVAAVLDRFRGMFQQVPPPVSAKRVGGKRAYALIRRGGRVALTPVSVHVERLETLSLTDDRLELRVTCSAGFYVRSLAHDIGRALGCGAHLDTLRRERSGDFDLDGAVDLDTVEREGRSAAARLIPLTALLPGLPGVLLTARGVDCATHGRPIVGTDIASAVAGRGDVDAEPGHRDPESWARLVAPDGSLVGVAAARPGGAWHPTVVLV